MYYLNVMAGPGEERAWKIVDDPEHAWLRGTWNSSASIPGYHCTHEEYDVVSKATAFKSPHDEPTVRLTVAQATIRSWPISTSNATANAASSSPAASASSATAMSPEWVRRCWRPRSTPWSPVPNRRCDMCWAATSKPWCTPPPLTHGRGTDWQTWVVTASIGPGSTNMLTGAALATINRLPVLLLPSDTFATRVSAPVLQELELPSSGDVTVNDASSRCRASLTGCGGRSNCPQLFSAR